MRFHSIAVLMFGSLIASSTHAADATPETKPLGDAGLVYTPPPDATWEAARDCSPKLADYVARAHDARVAMMIIDMEFSDAITAAVIKQLKAANQKAKLKVLMEPIAESDDRFALKVHERVEIGTGDKKKVSEQLHVYRYAGKQVVMATINTVATDPEAVKAELAAGEDMLLSVTGPGVKPPRKPASKPATRPVGKPLIRPTTRPKE